MEIALVTGASRGVGRGVAKSMAESGFKVFATGRQIEKSDLPESVTRIQCDHLKDEQTESVFKRIKVEAGPLDLLVNSAWGGYERMVEDGKFTWGLPFWEQAQPSVVKHDGCRRSRSLCLCRTRGSNDGTQASWLDREYQLLAGKKAYRKRNLWCVQSCHR